MATAQKTWTWDSSTESWTLSTAQRSTTEGSPNAGSLYVVTATGRNKDVSGTATLDSVSWASLFGIPSGANVTDVQVVAGLRYYAGLKSTGLDGWSYTVAVNDGGYQTVKSQSGTTAHSSWQTATEGAKYTLSTSRSASENADFRITLTASTGNGNTYVAHMYLDYLTIEVTYSAATTHDVTLALSSASSVTAIWSSTQAVWDATLALEAESNVSIGYSDGPRGTLIEAFSSTSDWSASNATLSLDTTHTREGQTQQVKLSISAGVLGSMYRTLSSPIDLSSTCESIELWFYLDPGSTFSTFAPALTVRIGTDSSNYWSRSKLGNTHPGWNCIRWAYGPDGIPSCWTAVGSPSWSEVSYFLFGMTAPSDTDISLTFCTLRAGAKGRRSAFLWTFDDGNSEVYDTARSILNNRGMHGTVYVNPSTIGGSGKMTSSQLQTLASDGHYIGSHGYDHTDMTTQTYGEVQQNVRTATQMIDSWVSGYGRHGAYPYIYYNETVLRAIRDLGGQRTWRSGSNVDEDIEEAALEPLTLNAVTDYEGSGVSWWTDRIDIANVTGTALIGLVHRPGVTMSTQNFTDICDHVVNEGIWAPNIDEWYVSYFGAYKVDATWDVTLTVESASSLTIVGSEVSGGVTHDVTLSPESASSVTAVASVTQAVWGAVLQLESASTVTVAASAAQAVWQVTLSLESRSAMATVGSVTQAAWDVLLAIESVSAVATTPSVVQAVHDIVVVIEATSTAAAVGRAIHDIALSLASTSGIAVSGSVVQTAYDVALAVESTSGVSAVGLKTEAVHDVLLALEGVAVVAVVGSVTQAAHEVVIALEAVSSVSAAGGKFGSHEVVLGLESTTAVTVLGSVVHATHNVGLALESASSVLVVGSVTGATHGVVLALEATSTVAVSGSLAQAVWDVVLALEPTSSVLALGSVSHASFEMVLAAEAVSGVTAIGSVSVTQTIHDLVLALESAASIAVAASVAQAIRDIALSVEVTTGVAIVAAKTETKDVVLGLMSTSSVLVVGSVTGAAHDVALAVESTSGVSAVGSATKAFIDLALALESDSAVAASGSVEQAVHEVWLLIDVRTLVAIALATSGALFVSTGAPRASWHVSPSVESSWYSAADATESWSVSLVW